MFDSVYQFSMPRETWIGNRSVEKLGPVLKKNNISKCLLVTDSFMAGSETGLKIQQILEQYQIDLSVYSGVTPNPTMDEVTEGLGQFLQQECDALISLGGGSPHDCAKGIKYSVLKGNVCSLEKVFFAAVNTTAGTASEITSFAVITDDEKHSKLTIVDEELIPDVAIDDPSLMLDMPRSLTAATGMDAMTHAIEAYVAKGRNYLTDSSAVSAIRLIDRYLAKACREGHDLEARNGMVYAQYMAGMAFSNAGLGIIHAMAHQLGGLYNLPHGVCNAALLPYGVRFNLNAGCDLYGELAKSLQLCTLSIPNKLAGERLVDYLIRFNAKLEMPQDLKQLNVNKEDFEKLAEMAMHDVSLTSNPVGADQEAIRSIFEKAYLGECK
ncbi:MAG TPA: iron-containing alcohol dehydrogenase [Clostridia bacterium]|nr:iron-containing alcohol dehydrogenase [Clostridia bacterium]